jgi:hypothetical protein
MNNENNQKIEQIAKELVRIERQCFYGDEPERDRLRKMRELIDNNMKDLKDDT